MKIAESSSSEEKIDGWLSSKDDDDDFNDTQIKKYDNHVVVRLPKVLKCALCNFAVSRIHPLLLLWLCLDSLPDTIALVAIYLILDRP
ncbi:hypothetical protein CDAR_382321 [Caerostris darwini]|uniref:Uncharacterized protein n=1 Tax=Caerostris darwini TaxID=1538125 RepID=A0AAV4VZA4_9ARAC|nr:hypothetical protein CDAR_382321 [Caerostris darwini]